MVPPAPVRPQGGGRRRHGDREACPSRWVYRQSTPTTAKPCRPYDYPYLRRWLRTRGIIPRIARRGIENSTHLGPDRWVVEHTITWLTGCRRLHRRYERKPDHFLAFNALAAVLIWHRVQWRDRSPGWWTWCRR
ncbi:transposase [Streptomyces sp. NPDC049099]|uniref:transposase n=1 Tax=Streptomyces sp. NPDC049099 TaxID=3155768 RepID=UPI0034328D49